MKYKLNSILTLLSFGLKAAYYSLVIPLLITDFKDENLRTKIFVIITIFNLKTILDLGFAQTITRYSAYLFSRSKNAVNTEVCKTIKDLETLTFHSKGIYKLVSVVSLFVTVGILVINSFQSGMNYTLLEILLTSIALSTSIYTQSYVSILNGVNKIQFCRYAEIVTYITIIILTVITKNYINVVSIGAINLLCFLGLLVVLKNKLANIVITCQKLRFSKSVFKLVFYPSFKIGISVLLSLGLGQIVFLTAPEINQSPDMDDFLFYYRIFLNIGLASSIYLYANIGIFCKESTAQNNKLKTKLNKIIFLSILTQFICSITFVVIMNKYKHILNLNYSLNNEILLVLMISIICERLGALKLQKMTIYNNIKIHWANFIMGFVFIVLYVIKYSNLSVEMYVKIFLIANITYLIYAMLCDYTSKFNRIH